MNSIGKWFYIVASEPAAWYSLALKARDLAAAKAKFTRLYPHATLVSIEA